MEADYIYHIIPELEWNAGKNQVDYSPSGLAVEGFIHFSYKEQIAGTAERYYREIPGLVVLKVSLHKVKPEIRVEQAPNGGWYPHVYGPLNRDSVESVLSLDKDEAGHFFFKD